MVNQKNNKTTEKNASVCHRNGKEQASKSCSIATTVQAQQGGCTVMSHKPTTTTLS